MRSHTVCACLVIGSGTASAYDLTFRLFCDTSAVALQFDVSSTDPVAIDAPSFQGVWPHTVESAVIGSGATRFVVYSTTGMAISPDGEVLVTFSSPTLADGMLTISGVMASNASGVQTTASPTSLPIIESGLTGYRSQQVGQPMMLSAMAYDLDGTVVSMSFNDDGVPFSSVFSFQPGVTGWTPTTSGIHALSATATDSSGGDVTTSIGEVRAYEPGELATYADFKSIHFGAVGNPSDLEFSATPFGHGIANGIAWMLGINPNAPDFSKLPWGSVENTGSGDEFVFRFNRLASLPGASWDVLETPDLTPGAWAPVPLAWISETAVGDGTVDVEVRKPFNPATEPKGFLSLETTETP